MRLKCAGALSRERRLDLGYAAGAMAVTTAVMAWVLELWDAHLQIPMAPVETDAGHVLALVQSTLQNGWFLTNPDLGAPAGQEVYDYAAYNGDALHFALMKLLDVFTENAAPVVNVYFLLGFPLCAMSGFLLMRWMGISRPVAMVCAALFALAPNHFLRSEYHLFLGAYFLVPAAAYLVLAIYADKPLFAGRRRTLLTIGLAVLAALSDAHYAAFAILLVAAAGVLTFVARGSKRALVSAAAVVAVMGATVTLEMTPTLIHRLDHGVNEAVGEREAADSFEYSTNLTDLLFPARNHRLEPLDDLDDRYTPSVPVGHEIGDRLGFVAAAGFVWLLAVALAVVVGGGSSRLGRDSRHRHLSAGATTAFLIGTTGGVSGLIAFLVTPQVRSWNRISIFITLFALIAVALLLDALRSRMRRRSLAAVAVGGVLVLGVLDQTNPSFAPDHEALAAQWRSDGQFVSEIERRMPDGALILQLPYLPYPENPPVGSMGDYAHVRAYLHSRSLRWSYGAMKGRSDDWLAPLAGGALSAIVERARELGFHGVYVDRLGYEDGGAAVEAELAGLSGGDPLVSPDERLAFFALPAS